jgi:hypothetical protein
VNSYSRCRMMQPPTPRPSQPTQFAVLPSSSDLYWGRLGSVRSTTFRCRPSDPDTADVACGSDRRIAWFARPPDGSCWSTPFWCSTAKPCPTQHDQVRRTPPECHRWLASFVLIEPSQPASTSLPSYLHQVRLRGLDMSSQTTETKGNHSDDHFRHMRHTEECRLPVSVTDSI